MKSWISVFAILLTVSGCGTDPKSGAGFTLPDGDAQRGQATFVRLQCNVCHSVINVELDPPELPFKKMVALGGETPRVKTYGDLVTSIINPSHRFAPGLSEDETQVDGNSKMRIYNDEMTVTELMDLVAFLQAHYTVKAYQPTPYMPYY